MFGTGGMLATRSVALVRSRVVAEPTKPEAEIWQDQANYARLRGTDRAGLMWEWLRRDPEYVAWYARATRATLGGVVDPARDDVLQWGLHFR